MPSSNLGSEFNVPGEHVLSSGRVLKYHCTFFKVLNRDLK